MGDWKKAPKQFANVSSNLMSSSCSRVQLSNWNSALIPMAINAIICSILQTKKEQFHKHHKLYCQQARYLLYVFTFTRPEITFAVCTIARRLHTKLLIICSRFAVSFLTFSLNTTIASSFKNVTMTSHWKYWDLDQARCKKTIHSIAGFGTTCNQSPVGWKILFLCITSLSSANSE